jgi:hypothetical protein
VLNFLRSRSTATTRGGRSSQFGGRQGDAALEEQDFSPEIKRALEGLWSSSSVPGSQKSAEQFALSCQACGLPESFTIGEIAKKMIMMIMLHAAARAVKERRMRSAPSRST